MFRRFTLTIIRGRLTRQYLRYPACETRGCHNPGNTCYLPDDTEMFYCYKHMRDAGFCPGCHNFWAGVESFDFSRTGYCENCEGDNFDFDDDDEYDDWFDPFFEPDENLRIA